MIVSPAKCPSCFGDGWVPIVKVISTAGDLTYSELEEVGQEDCPECNGTGEEINYAYSKSKGERQKTQGKDEVRKKNS
tara:strand:+ start:70 stop:303 length:234 start_codon:yes stop_codon:yes gene_type:complete